MGIYGNYAKALAEKQRQSITNEFDIDIDLHSVVYEEYQNRKMLLTECTSDYDRTILETQLDVLYEVSIKDIGERIKKAIDALIKKIKEIIQKIKDFFFGKKREGMKKKTSDLEDELKAAQETIRFMKSKQQTGSEKSDGEKEVLKDQIKGYEDKIASMVEKMADNELLYFDVKKYMDPSKKVEHGFVWSSRNLDEELKKSLDGIYAIFTDVVKNKCIETKDDTILNTKGEFNSIKLSGLITDDCEPDKQNKPKDIMGLYSLLKNIEETNYKNEIQTTLYELESSLKNLSEEVEKSKVSSNYYKDLDGKEKYESITRRTYTVHRKEKGVIEYEPDNRWDPVEKIENKFEGLGKQIKTLMGAYQSAIVAVNIINNQYMKQIGFADSCISALSVFSNQVINKKDKIDEFDKYREGLNDKNIAIKWR